MANSKLYLGDINIGAFKFGSSDISLYLGNNKVYPTRFEGKFMGINASGTSYVVNCNSSSTLTQNEVKPDWSTYNSYVSIQIGDCVETLGENAFINTIRKLSSFTMSDSVKYISNYALTCFPTGFTSVTNITLSSNITTIGDNGLNGFNMQSDGVLEFPNLVSVGSYFLWHCGNVKTVKIGSKITSIGSSFLDYENYSQLNYPKTLIIEASTPPNLGSNAFKNTVVTAIYVPCNSVDLYKNATNWSAFADKIQPIEGTCTFSGKFRATYSGDTTYTLSCNTSTTLTDTETKPSGYDHSSMISAEIGSCVETLGMSTFSSCRKLSSVTISNGVTVIGAYSFNSCTSLSSITIPSSVTAIGGGGVFQYCSSLSSVIVEATTPPNLGNTNVFSGTSSDLVIYVPASSVDAYKSATNWSNFSSIIQPITN